MNLGKSESYWVNLGKSYTILRTSGKLLGKLYAILVQSDMILREV